MKIRPPTLAESYHVVSLMDAGLRGVDSAYDYLTRTPARRWLARRLTLPPYFHWLNEGWIIEEAGEIRGWLYLLHRARSTHINDIGVAPAFRRQGYGRRLIGWAEQRAREKAKEALTLAVTGTNTPAIALYERSGFRALHHHLWQGTRESLPCVPSAVTARELSSPQRPEPFQHFWSASLTADGQPVGPLIGDQISYWYTERGTAWELWEGRTRVGYADYVEKVLRIFLDNPLDGATLQRAWSALRPHLSAGALRLDLGSDRADEAARSLLGDDWRRTAHERLLMAHDLPPEL